MLVQIEREKLQAIFDLAVNSLDFSSGFWGSDEVAAAREIAEMLGVDPMEATPAVFRKSMPHDWKAPKDLKTDCHWCGVQRDEHQGGEGP